MAESFLIDIAENVFRKLGSLALEEFSFAWGLRSDLEKIKKILVVINAVLFDAEEHQLRSQQIQFWLGMLKDVLYDAEDVVDEFECEALRRKVVESGKPLERSAFKGEQEKQNPNLIRIGEEIVRKCKGIPLAVITLANLLYSVTDEHDWEFIRVMKYGNWNRKKRIFCLL
ncbi:hypothetical protein GH714_033248 [Hevea brasiliensis]|uniref:Disease resistance N-terminal domain-containing protein n=1 Tax=Hevea brasiliensis TaxID=3981 RepID=A0A6A6M5T6_HEVBR|nr:hypothetical protein GH714_033248 [Hevea brasiliensis]